MKGRWIVPKELGLGTVGELRGGLVGKVFDKKVAAALADCADRPKNKTPRVVTLKLAFTPDDTSEHEGNLDRVNIETQCTVAVPAQRIKAHEAAIRQRLDRATGQQVFSAVIGGDADDVTQGTLDEA